MRSRSLSELGLVIALANSLWAAEERPNILLILSDDHSAAHVGCYGDKNVRTPNLDRLAASGMRFERVYVTAPQCVPSRASLMTGRSPVRIQMTRFSAPLPADVVAFPELLRAGGYYTGICGRNFHLDGSGRMPPETSVVFDKHNLRTFDRRVDWLMRDGSREKVPGLIREFLGKVPSGKPFFLQAGFSDPHRIYDPPKTPDPTALNLPPHFPDTLLLRQDFSRYYGEIERLDGDVGRLLDVLEEHGLAQNTLVVFMGDNGAALLRGKGTLYEFGVRVPLLVRWPGKVKPGTVSSELVSGEDIAPTFLEAAGVTAPKEMTGISFLKQLLGQAFTARKFVFVERGAHGSSLPTNTVHFDLGRCIVSKTHKFIYTALPTLPYTPVDFSGDDFWKEIQAMHKTGKLASELSRLYFPPARPMFELYDLQNDPAEFRNLAGKPEAALVEQELKAALQEWMILERDFLPLPVPPAPAGR